MCVNNYPLIFKEKVISFYKSKNKYTVKDILNIYDISNGSLYNWINRDKNNNLQEKAKYNKISKYTPAIKCYIRVYVLRNKIFNCNKLISLLKKQFNISASKTSIYEILKYMDLTRKRICKKFYYGNQIKHREKLKNFKNKIKTISMDNIISIDETSIDTRIIPIYGWNKKGKKLEMKVHALKKRYTVICAISNEKIVHYEIINGSANAEIFKTFIENLNNKIDNKYLLLDNARIHHSQIIKKYIMTTNNELLFNVPYTPKYNPIEHIFAILKNNLRKLKTNNNSTKLQQNIKKIINRIPKKFINNCYKKSLKI